MARRADEKAALRAERIAREQSEAAGRIRRQRLSDNVLGRASAPVSIIEYGDLECSVCDSLALSASVDTSDGTPGSGVEDQIIDDLVRTGKVKLIYRSLETETGNGATPDEWTPRQVAVDAAGIQHKAWNYHELFYNEQGQEGSDYVDAAYLVSGPKGQQVVSLGIPSYREVAAAIRTVG